jgi:hypothetical protein
MPKMHSSLVEDFDKQVTLSEFCEHAIAEKIADTCGQIPNMKRWSECKHQAPQSVNEITRVGVPAGPAGLFVSPTTGTAPLSSPQVLCHS